MNSRRRNLMATLAAVVLAGVAGALWWQNAGRSVTAPAPLAGEPLAGKVPVIIYLIDALRADRLGLSGYSRPTSPRIDALAAESVYFERAYATAPWTLPSLASLVTSTFPCEHGVVSRGLKLGAGVPTLAEHLRSTGMSTAAYYHNAYAGSVAGLDRGYDVSVLREGEASFPALIGDVRDYLGRVGDEPFFLYLHTMEPHQVFGTPSEALRQLGVHVGVDDRAFLRDQWFRYRELMHVDFIRKAPRGSSDTGADIDSVSAALAGQEQQLNDLYDGAVRLADQRVGEVVDLLRTRGLWDKAIFIVVADHGEEFGEHGGWFHDQSVYEELIHVPLLVHFPGGQFGGQRIRDRVSLLDLMPTVLDYLGETGRCAECRGSSLLSLLAPAGRPRYASAPVPAMRRNEQTYDQKAEERRGDINVVVRDGNWKGIWNRGPGTLELYDLESDPGETRDSSSEQQERAIALTADAENWFDLCAANPRETEPTRPEDFDERSREILRSHGYFQ